MVLKTSSIAEAYSILGLEQGSTLEEVKSTYKQLALRTHPDKNPNNPDATSQFQRLSSAYNTLAKHLDRSAPQATGFSPFEFYDDDEYPDSEDEDEDLQFCFFVFEEMMREHAAQYFRSRYTRPSGATQPREERFRSAREERVARERAREEQEAAAKRHAKEVEARKARLERDREREKREAEGRKKQKAEKKRAQAEATRRKAEDVARARVQQAQSLRSATFAAARSGKAAQVRKGVWEDSVDASGGEILANGNRFVKSQPKDLKETLLHIAAERGDTDLLKWLDAHSADLEEKNSQGFTAFHIAMKKGHIPIAMHFFESYPPNTPEYEAIYEAPPPHTLLSLSIDSVEPELVWQILDKRLATSEDLNSAWVRVTSGVSGKEIEEKMDEIRSILKVFGGFTPPLSPKNDAFPASDLRPPADEQSLPVETSSNAAESHSQSSNQREPRQKKPSSRRKPPHVAHDASHPATNGNVSGESHRGKGRGRGHIRGSGRGRGKAPV